MEWSEILPFVGDEAGLLAVVSTELRSCVTRYARERWVHVKFATDAAVTAAPFAALRLSALDLYVSPGWQPVTTLPRVAAEVVIAARPTWRHGTAVVRRGKLRFELSRRESQLVVATETTGERPLVDLMIYDEQWVRLRPHRPSCYGPFVFSSYTAPRHMDHIVFLVNYTDGHFDDCRCSRLNNMVLHFLHRDD